MSDSAAPASEKDPWNTKSKEKFETKSKSEFYDPCQEAAQRSYKCLYRNGGDKSMCGEYFQAYRDCKAAWVRIPYILESGRAAEKLMMNKWLTAGRLSDERKNEEASLDDLGVDDIKL